MSATEHTMESECSEEIENNHTEMETEKSSDPTCDAKQDITSPNENTDDPFKKPVIFVAPSLTVKKPGGSKSTKKPTEELSSRSENNDTDLDTKQQQPSAKPTDTQTDPSDHPSSERSEAQKVQPKPKDIRPKIPAKLPPAGKFPPLPYTEPPWGCVPDINYSFELLKNGAILDTVPLTQNSYFVVGRLPVCDVSLEHPSISRYHAVVQYRGRAGEDGVVGEERGFYAYDLGSTHGTFVNKNKIPPKTYIRLRVGHVIKFGGSTRLFILQGPEFDEEAESELTVTELRERARKQREALEKRMMGDGSDDDEEEKEESDQSSATRKSSSEDIGCSWGMAEEAAPEEDENEENPFATEFQEDQEAAYLKDPKKALQGFYDREGEELEFEYEEKGHGTWLCRIKLPVDDALGRQLVAEVTHTGKKKEAAIQCCLEACRMLEARGLLRQEAVSRKRKKKNWEDEDFYDSDDDTFLDRTGAVEKKRTERMKKAGKIQERPDTYESLLTKLAKVEKELADTEKRLNSSGKGGSSSSTEDPLDAFMSAVRSEVALDGVERKKLHLHVAELKKEGQRLRKLADLAKPTQLPSLQPGGSSQSTDTEKPKKLSLPMFGAMKGGNKFRLKTGTIGTLPPKRANLPPELFNMKELPPGGEKEEEEEEEEEKNKTTKDDVTDGDMEVIQSAETASSEHASADRAETLTHHPNEKEDHEDQPAKIAKSREKEKYKSSHLQKNKSDSPPKEGVDNGVSNVQSPKTSTKKKVMGPSRPPVTMSKQYPEDDPDYCVWVPPSGQTGDGRTHLNDKYGY
ncbi:kanadaptin [Ctenopharyngodon idella]|uniref:kanadaptin n=1 Tax=Ctenopharyngodon idella TaxID=7959 RepID=UPI00222F35C4|nr:kanadaptin [Ctenopharyngodon idella]